MSSSSLTLDAFQVLSKNQKVALFFFWHFKKVDFFNFEPFVLLQRFTCKYHESLVKSHQEFFHCLHWPPIPRSHVMYSFNESMHAWKKWQLIFFVCLRLRYINTLIIFPYYVALTGSYCATTCKINSWVYLLHRQHL